LLRFGAVLIVLTPLVLFELVLRLFAAPPIAYLDDPYVSFGSLDPLFVLDSAGERFQTAEERLAFFRRQSFAAAKDPTKFRIFCLGGSTVQGRPYSVESSFTTWLKLNVDAAHPGMHSEVVNCGGISYASYRLVPIMREVLAFEPDLLVIYTGHNEFLEDRTYGHIKEMPRLLKRLHRGLLSLSSYAHAYHFLSAHRARSRGVRQPSRTVLPAEVRARLDAEDGPKSYHRDQTWREGIIRHFHHNLDTMVQMCRRAGVPVVLVNPVSNLKDCPPFKSEFSEDLPESQRQHILALLAQADDLSWTDVYGKIALLERAASMDGRHAGVLYRLGRCYAHIGRWVEAGKWFALARDEDICPLRILEDMHEAIGEIAARHRVPMVDAKALIEERTEGGVPGSEWLLDHVHPNISGHQLIADAVYETMEDMELLQTPAGWRAARDVLWRHHFSSLDDAYYSRGIDRLKSLHTWSRGHTPTQ